MSNSHNDNKPSSSIEENDESFPSSLEESGALLGMAITQLTLGASSTPSSASSLAPPAGMHSSFRVVRPVSNTNLFIRLYELRALLRSAQTDEPLAVAPSLLAVLIKLIGVSTYLAPAYLTGSTSAGATTAGALVSNSIAFNTEAGGGSGGMMGAGIPPVRAATPPMLSNGLRHLWVDCVTLCHVRGAGLTGSARINTSQFLRQMLALASQNPRTARAAGGVRIAALDVVTALLLVDEDYNKTVDDNGSPFSMKKKTTSQPLVLQTAPWALDMLQVCLKALKSAGNGEATYRQSAGRMAIAVAIASRRAQLLRLEQQGDGTGTPLVLPGAMEDKALLEATKILKQATQDKLPEVRLCAAQFAAHLAPLLIPKDITAAGGLSVIEDTLSLAWRNLDDESPYTLHSWSEAVARILATMIQYHSSSASARTTTPSGSPNRRAGVGNGGANNSQGGGTSATTQDNGNGSDAGPRTTPSRVAVGGGGRVTLLSQATSLKRVLLYLVDQFVKAGGELVAARMGGSFSTGGRGARVGIGLVISHFLQIRTHLGEDAHTINMLELVQIILAMVGGPDMDKQLRPPDGLGATLAVGFAAAVTTRHWSKADAGVARTITCRVLRDGISQVSSEPVQLALLEDLISFVSTTTKVISSDSSQPSQSTNLGAHVASLLNANQLQCVLVEMSHLMVTLGEGITAKVSEIVVALKACLEHEDYGVRHEAAVACHSLCVSHPHTCRELVTTALVNIQIHHAQMMTVSSGSVENVTEDDDKNKASKMRMFRRKTKEIEPVMENTESDPHLRGVHGLCLMVAMLIREMPNCPGGLPEELSQTVASVGEILIASQFNEILGKSNGKAVCYCVRGGYNMIAALTATGPQLVSTHVPRIFIAWQKACNSAKVGGRFLTPYQDLVCIEAVLYSVLVFLKYCSELLMAIPEALTQVTVLLEEILPLLTSDGRLGSLPLSSNISTRLESARASLLESFAWLPAGSYPMVADSVFAFASENIQAAVYSEIPCSILQDLLCREDSILDTCSLSRVKRDGQSGAARDLDQTVLLLTAEFSHYEEREAVLHLNDRIPIKYLDGREERFRGSHILALHCRSNEVFKPPTPLHEVGMWRRPMDPSSSAKIRLVDAAVQAFAATFGLKSGKEQQAAMNVLEALVPQYFAQLTRTLNSSLTDQSKLKDENAPVANITAVLLLCLQSLPLHESTHDVPVGLGPPWMNKAKDILLALLPSASNAVRRAAAEGLALLATLGVTEDAHFLRSTVLHSLDEVRQGNKPDGKPRTIAVEPISAARAGSLLTLACIQRTESKVMQRQIERARGRVEHLKATNPAQGKETHLPVLQMMTRILPSIGNYGFTDFFEVRAYALQSFQVLLAYSSRLEKSTLDTVDRQLLRKAVEIVEDNVCSAWIVASNDLDKGHESEKMGAECSFLAVVLRFMSYITPLLKLLKPEDGSVLRRFCVIARVILERNGEHPAIAFEGMIFFEVMAKEASSLPPSSYHIRPTDNPRFSMVPTLATLLVPMRPQEYASTSVLFSFDVLRSAVFVLRALAEADLSVFRVADARFIGLLAAAFEFVTGGKHFLGTGLLRSMVVPRRVDSSLAQTEETVGEIIKIVPRLILNEQPNPHNNYMFHLRCLLLAKALLSGVGSVEEMHGNIIFDKEHVIRKALLVAKADASELFKVAAPPRWQSKTLAAQIASCCLREIIASEQQAGAPAANSHHFNTSLASMYCEKQCQQANGSITGLPNSLVAFHLPELVASACMASVAALDQSELFLVQESSLFFLSDIIASFCQIPDPEMPGSHLLHQYSQQIYSVVKHGLSSIDEIQTEGSFRVFLASCWTVSIIINEKMTTEASVIKRLVRALVPSDEQLVFGPINMRKPVPIFPEAGNYSNLIKVAKLSYTGAILFREDAAREGSVDAISTELVKDRAAFGVESALVALEGARLLRARNLSLVGALACSENGEDEALFPDDDYHSDFTAMHLVTNAWPSCARASLCALNLAIREVSIIEEQKEECFRWMQALGSVVLCGCEDSIEAIGGASQLRGAFAVDAEAVLVECLKSLALLLRASDVLPPASLDVASVGHITALLQRKIVEPIVTRKTPILKRRNVIKNICSLFQDLTFYLVQLKDQDHDTSAVFSLILCPMNELQKGHLTSEREPPVADIINATQRGMTVLVKNGQLADGLVRTVVDFIARQLLQTKDDFALQLHDAAKSLLLECLSQSAVSFGDKKRVMLHMAQAWQWDVWGILFRMIGDIDVTDSLATLKQLLVNATESDAHIAALTALGAVVKSLDSIDVVGRVVASVGVELLGLLHHYGTMASTVLTEPNKRKECFADTLKVVLILYQQLLKESYLAEFLSTIFETFIAVLRFNGLPNYPSPQEKGEAALGRLVAQAVLHVARTSPEPFKVSMGSLNDQDRTILEFAVRGEMTGYAPTAGGQAPAKKKLNLKSFKK